jgi:hypothetical protein
VNKQPRPVAGFALKEEAYNRGGSRLSHGVEGRRRARQQPVHHQPSPRPDAAEAAAGADLSRTLPRPEAHSVELTESAHTLSPRQTPPQTAAGDAGHEASAVAISALLEFEQPELKQRLRHAYKGSYYRFALSCSVPFDILHMNENRARKITPWP